MAVDRLVDRRLLGAAFVAVLCAVVLVTLAGPVSPAFAYPGSCGVPGGDGPQPALGGTVNTYFPGTSTSVAVGATSLTVGASVGASTPIAAGDKLLIIQMQSAALDSTNTDAYGDGVAGEPPSGATSWASAGTYEFAIAANSVSTAGGTLQLSVGVLNAYASSAATATMGQQTFQVVRVPQYSSAILGSNVTATPWNGAAGGIVALDVAGDARPQRLSDRRQRQRLPRRSREATRGRCRRGEHRCQDVCGERIQRWQGRGGSRHAAIRLRRCGHHRHGCRGLSQRQFRTRRTRQRRRWRHRRQSDGERPELGRRGRRKRRRRWPGRQLLVVEPCRRRRRRRCRPRAEQHSRRARRRRRRRDAEQCRPVEWWSRCRSRAPRRRIAGGNRRDPGKRRRRRDGSQRRRRRRRERRHRRRDIGRRVPCPG